MRNRTRALLGSLAAAAFVAFTPAGASADTYWQCVPFARLISGIQIFGDAWTWWQQASGRYETGFQPRAGAVLCFKPTRVVSHSSLFVGDARSLQEPPADCIAPHLRMPSLKLQAFQDFAKTLVVDPSFQRFPLSHEVRRFLSPVVVGVVKMLNHALSRV